MRVLFVNHTSTISGGERSLLTVLDALPSDIEPIVACPNGPLAEEVEASGMNRVRISPLEASFRLHARHTGMGLGRALKTSWELHRAAASRRVDLVDANSVRAGLAVAASPLARTAPTVVHVRDALPSGVLADALLRFICRRTAATVANSAYIADRMPDACAPAVVLHSPVDLDAFSPARHDKRVARERLGLPDNAPIIGLVAQLTPWKGQDDAIRALAMLQERHPTAMLLLIGSAKFLSAATRYDNRQYERDLHALVRALGLEDRVVFLGERSDIPAVLEALDLVIAPSWQEPFGRSVAEAMAMSVPVVATARGGPAEVIEDGRTGMLLEPREPALWAQAIADLLDSPERLAELARGGLRRARESLGVADHMAELGALYERLLAGNQSAPTGVAA